MVYVGMWGERRTHALATDDISEPTEEELSNERANGCGNLDTEILIRSGLLTGTINIADHDGGDVNRKDVVTKVGDLR